MQSEGSQTGSQTGSQAGSQTGSQAGNETDSQTGNKHFQVGVQICFPGQAVDAK